MDRKSFIKASIIGSLCSVKSFADSVDKASKIAVVYYSWSGNTKYVAEQIASFFNAKLFEIEPSVPYTKNYGAVVEQAKKELNAKFKPQLKSIPNLAEFDFVFLGTPNWWGTFASPIRTFLDKCDMSKKTIVPFITHKGSAWGDYLKDLKYVCKNSDIKEGLELWGSSSLKSKKTEQEISKWCNSIKIES